MSEDNERINKLEVQQKNICEDIKQISKDVIGLRDNHIEHLKKDINGLKLQFGVEMAELKTSFKNLNRNFKIFGGTVVVAILVNVVVSLID